MVFAERVELHLVGIEKTFPASFSQQDSATGFYTEGEGGKATAFEHDDT